MSGRTRRVTERLRAEWFVAAVAAVAVVAAGKAALAAVVPHGAARGWLAVAGGVLAYELGFLRYHLGRNCPSGGARYASIGPGNAITLCRGMLYAATAGFLLVPPTHPLVRWAPAVCYGLGAALDLADGYVARLTDRTTLLGAKLDMAFDTLGFLVAPLVGVAWGRLPVWYLSVGLARYLFRGAKAVRARRGRPIRSLPDSRLRRPVAAGQMAFVAVAVAPVLPPSAIYPAAAVAALPTLGLFVRDWLVVSGRLPAGSG